MPTPRAGGQPPALGVGIPGMRERVRQLGGSFEIVLSLRCELSEPGVFPGELLRALRIVERVRPAESGFDFGESARELLDLGTQVHDR